MTDRAEYIRKVMRRAERIALAAHGMDLSEAVKLAEEIIEAEMQFERHPFPPCRSPFNEVTAQDLLKAMEDSQRTGGTFTPTDQDEVVKITEPKLTREDCYFIEEAEQVAEKHFKEKQARSERSTLLEAKHPWDPR